MRYTKCLLIGCMLLISGCTPVNPIGKSEISGDTMNIGILHHEENDKTKQKEKGFIDYLSSRGFDRIKVTYKSKNGLGKSEIDDLFIEQFVNEGVDLIYVIDKQALHSATALMKDTEIPLLYSGINESEVNQYQISNMSGVLEEEPLGQQFSTIRSILPEAKTIMVLNDSKMSWDNIQSEADLHGFTLLQFQSLETIEPIEEVEIDTYLYLGQEKAESFYEAFKDQNLPMFTNHSESVKLGYTAAITLDDYAIGSLVGKMSYDVLIEGKPMSELLNNPYVSTSITLNQKEIDALSLVVPDFISKKANYIN